MLRLHGRESTCSPITGNSHENLVYCFGCHGRNPEIAYNTSSSARSRDVIEIDGAPSRSSISTMSHMAPRFTIGKVQRASDNHNLSGIPPYEGEIAEAQPPILDRQLHTTWVRGCRHLR